MRDWSPSGFRLARSFENAKAGERISGTIHVPGTAESGAFAAQVIRVDDNGVALRFLGVERAVSAAMAALAVTQPR